MSSLNYFNIIWGIFRAAPGLYMLANVFVIEWLLQMSYTVKPTKKNKKNMALFGLNFELEIFPFSYGAPLDVHVSAFTGFNSRA